MAFKAALEKSADISLKRPLEGRLFATRDLSMDLARPLTPEDQTVQSMPDASPTKWHLAHTTWFFETFILGRCASYRVFDDKFGFCFNSYYETEGPRHPRAARGLLTRPTVDEVAAYRAHVDAGLRELFAGGEGDDPEMARLIEIGINHEQQHQELLLMDILHLFSLNPLRPKYRVVTRARDVMDAGQLDFITFRGGVREIGHAGDGFAFDNEGPRHQVLLRDYKLATRAVTNGEWLDFMRDGGYDTPTLWLADGWAHASREDWRAPLYFEEIDGAWTQMSLDGPCLVDPAAPVCHISYYEADAFARWAGRRLPTEFEWEAAAAGHDPSGAMLGSGALRPTPAASGKGLRQMFGDVWEWTQSAYQAYPGYRPPSGAIGEYNGKFMISQQVLKGGACITPDDHVRASYRNFFYPHQRWQFAGARLADEAN